MPRELFIRESGSSSRRSSRRDESEPESSLRRSSRRNESEPQSSSRRDESEPQSSSRRSSRRDESEPQSSSRRSSRRDESEPQSFYQTTSTSSAISAQAPHFRHRKFSLTPFFFNQEVVDKELDAYIAENCDEGDYFANRLRITGINVGSPHVRSSPFFELHSIEVFPNSDRSPSVYGDVSLTDGKGNFIALYKKSEDEAESLDYSNELWLGDCITVVPLKYFKLFVHLLDTSSNSICLANRSFSIEFSTSDDFWGLKECTIENNRGIVKIKYRCIVAAVVADLSVMVSKQSSDTDDDRAHICGHIRSRRDPPFQNLGASEFDLTHFNADVDDPVELEDEPLNLYRNQLIVPTCSSLSLGLQIYDADNNDIIIKGLVKFKAFFPAITRRVIWSADEKWSVVVEVYWNFLDDYSNEPQIPNMENLSLAPRNEFQWNFSSCLVEIYSISINSAEVDANIRGNITIRDADGVSYIFKSNNFCRDIALWWPSRCLKADQFRMNLKLRYREGLPEFDGYLHLSYRPEHFNTRLCSVIKSDFGFATIHYFVFESCLQGNVSISLVSPGLVPMDVDGMITARTTNFEKNAYNNNFYRNVLFEVPCQKTYYTQSGSILPLQKSTIVGPRGCSVIIKPDVVIYERFPTHRRDRIRCELEYQVGHDNILSFESDNGYSIYVSLEWKLVT